MARFMAFKLVGMAKENRPWRELLFRCESCGKGINPTDFSVPKRDRVTPMGDQFPGFTDPSTGT